METDRSMDADDGDKVDRNEPTSKGRAKMGRALKKISAANALKGKGQSLSWGETRYAMQPHTVLAGV